MPQVSDEYFAKFTPAAMALVCEASLLNCKLGILAGIEAGLIWAVVRNIERGDIRCSRLAALSSERVEKCYRNMFRRLDNGIDVEHVVELNHTMNMLSLLPPRKTLSEAGLDYRRDVSACTLLCSVIAALDFRYGGNRPLKDVGLNIRSIHKDLEAEGAFIVGERLERRGSIPDDKKDLYIRACIKAAYVGSWLITGLHTAVASIDLGVTSMSVDKAETEAKWNSSVGFAQRHVSQERCQYLLSFPGIRPWLPSAASALGVEVPEA